MNNSAGERGDFPLIPAAAVELRAGRRAQERRDRDSHFLAAVERRSAGRPESGRRSLHQLGGAHDNDDGRMTNDRGAPLAY